MTFILSNDGRDEDVRAAFIRYQEYLDAHKNKFPSSAYALATSDWYYNFKSHQCPHDAWLEQVSIVEPSTGDRQEVRKTNVIIKLFGAYHDGYIELNYKNVTALNIDAFNVKEGHGDWLYDEFRVSESGRLLHEIEWCGGSETANWLIEAEDIKFEWIDG